MVWISVLIISAITWYTINVGRVAWRHGNKFGAVGVGILAALTFLLSVGILVMPK